MVSVIQILAGVAYMVSGFLALYRGQSFDCLVLVGIGNLMIWVQMKGNN